MNKFLATLFFTIAFSHQFIFASQQNPRNRTTEAGIPFITHYAPSIYESHGQNWAIAQDSNGFMYFGNTDGCVLQYDGEQWRQIPISNGSIVRSLEVNPNGIIFVGAQNEIGYLAPDSFGTLQYVSIITDIPQEFRDFGDVWQIHFIHNNLFFSTRKYLFRRDKNGNYKVWQAENVFHASFCPNPNQLFIHQRKTGLMVLENDRLKLIPGGERFKDDRVYALTRFDTDRVLIISRNSGLFLYDGKQLQTFVTPAEQWLINNQVYHAIVLNNNQIVVSTLRGGLLVLDQKGEILSLIDKESGLQDNRIWFSFQDRQGSLWLALNKGIAHVEYPGAWSSYNEKNGLEGNVHDIIRHNGVIYAATGMGVYRLKSYKGKPEKNKFEILKGLESQCWALLSLKDRLLVSCNRGIFEYRDKQFYQISKKSAWQLYISQRDSNRIYMGLDQGISSLYKVQNKWVNEENLSGLTANARTLAEDNEGKLWVGTVYEGVYQIEFQQNTNIVTKIKHFDESFGLPTANYNLVFQYKREVVFGTSEGVFIFDKGNEKFKSLPITNDFPKPNNTFTILSNNSQGNLWANSESKLIELLPNKDESFTARYEPYLRLPEISIHCIYPEKRGLLWVGSPQGVFCYDPSQKKDIKQKFPAYIRRVISFADSVIYDGSYNKKYRSPFLPYSSEALRFEFATPYYISEEQNTYRYILKGFDNGWSDWTSETKKDYTNLPEGEYTFKVQAQNIYGQISSQALFSLVIQAPLYRRWWAYLVYIFVLISIVTVTLTELVAFTRRKAIMGQQKVEETRKKMEGELRSQVAADFHDEIGTRITRISLFSEILKKDLADISDSSKTYLEKISQNADNLYSETRDFIWQLDPKSDTVMDLISRIKSFTDELLEETNIKFEIKNRIPKANEIRLAMDLRRNLIRIFKEAIHNSFKYAQCNTIVLDLAQEGEKLIFILNDDGIGFDTKLASEGNGLKNIKTRARKINGNLEINSQLQEGTLLKLSVKI